MKHVLVYGMTDNPGGIEAYLLSLFRRQQDRAVHFDFVTDFPHISGETELTAGGANIHHIPAKSKDLLGHLRGMRRILRQHPEYETLYFNVLDAGAVVTMLPAALLGRKIVVHSHNAGTDKTRLHRLCRPVMNLLTSERVACSGLAAAYLFGKRGENALRIPNAISVERFAFRDEVRQKLREELELGDRPVFIHVARLSRQKNPMGLLDIFQAIRDQRPDALLLSVGDGEMREQFFTRIRETGLENSVKCLGVQEDVAALLQAADVFLLPSFYEGLPISLMEAQAASLPCLVSDAVTREAGVTDLVRFLPLEATPEIWAENALSLLGVPRQDTREAIRRQGFDSACCEELDEQLVNLF